MYLRIVTLSYLVVKLLCMRRNPTCVVSRLSLINNLKKRHYKTYKKRYNARGVNRKKSCASGLGLFSSEIENFSALTPPPSPNLKQEFYFRIFRIQFSHFC